MAKKVVKKNKGGRPTKYKEEYCKDILEFFSIPTTYEQEITNFNKKTGEEYITIIEKPNNLPTFEGYAKKICVDMDTLKNWTRDHKKLARLMTAVNNYKKIS